MNNFKPKRNLLKTNDCVCINCAKGSIFEKASLQAWVKEVFKVDKVLICDRVVYTLKDLKGEPIQGIFYRSDLQQL